MISATRRKRISVEDIGDIAAVQFLDKRIVDNPQIESLGEDLLTLAEELGRNKLLLNFSNVEHMSSGVLGKLVTLHKRLNLIGGKLVLCAISPRIMEVFIITTLDKMLNIAKDERSGLNAF